jgi:hypothetical protein
MPGFVSLELKYSLVDSRIVVFEPPPRDPSNDERWSWHHYMIVNLEHGISFIFDFSDYQSGFSKVIYGLRSLRTMRCKRTSG